MKRAPSSNSMHTNRRYHKFIGDSDLSNTGFAAGVDSQRRLVIVLRWPQT
jgi:hypothetical protein